MQYLSKEEIKSCFITTVQYISDNYEKEDIPASIDALVYFMNNLTKGAWKEEI